VSPRVSNDARGGKLVATRAERPPKTIVIADDHKEVRTFIRAALRWLRCHIIEAENGQVALDVVGAHHPDLLILDWMMPQLDGLEVARALRSDPPTMALPILMVSAKGEEEKAKAYEAGVSDYLGKPFTVAQLRQRVRKLLGEEG
jgi:two-component system phosphate regulon response regulator PhoB